MTPNPLLSLAIPTYNRSEILLENLRAMLPDLMAHQVAVFISDDSTDDLTAQKVRALQQEYPLLTYRRNEPRHGHDANFFATVSMPDTDYVWYLGDSLFLQPGMLGTALEALATHRPDLCFVNAYVHDDQTRLLEGDDVHAFLLDRTWYLTLSGATIYSRGIRMLPVEEARKWSWKNFPQLGLILEACSRAPRRLLWLGPTGIAFNRKKSSYWLKSAFDVFVKDWTTLIRSFPTLFSRVEQDRIIRSHAEHTQLFNLVSLLQLRAMGALTVETLQQHRQAFAIASPIPPWWASVVARVPVRAIHAARAVKAWRRQRKD
ncbi:glycosyltransferase family 2 protein [Roseateles terrae]|uniref:Glycosyltransferase involved in cell wall biosynthesis n=1 Tax=Roseateles terrae TaxID=431060 RepID=A0ABR6GST5_9BURK|nr:glycosyltransferase family 2 protein [Roseateles terrae]MBB3195168.1 glycosyltransferase involved in cell wall biosynthesis [Roseateles terrae]OWQ87188.1 hypothetical protein CDN98_10090 [Roseateles terrae]